MKDLNKIENKLDITNSELGETMQLQLLSYIFALRQIFSETKTELKDANTQLDKTNNKLFKIENQNDIPSLVSCISK